MSSRPDVTVTQVEQLAPGHLEAFVWRFAHRVPGLGLQVTLTGTLLERVSRSSCGQIWHQLDTGPRLEMISVPDGDGVFHLVGKDGDCGSSMTRTRCFVNRQLDPRSAIDPHQVRRSAQCPRASRVWPAYLGPGAQMAATKRKIAQACGGVCSLCRCRPCQLLDHDHLTGAIRGYLCRICNNQVDTCLHPADCPSHDYLVRPPLTHLGEQHPNHQTFTRRATYQERMTYYLQVMAGGISQAPLNPHDDWAPLQSEKPRRRLVAGAAGDPGDRGDLAQLPLHEPGD